MHDGLKAALGWACEMTSLERAAATLPSGTVMWLDFDVFLADPARHFAAIAAHFGHPAGRSGGDLRRAADAALFQGARI